MIVLGLFKKIAVADNLAPLVELGFHGVSGGTPALGPMDAWCAVLAFTLSTSARSRFARPMNPATKAEAGWRYSTSAVSS